MHIVTVEIEVKPEHVGDFRARILEQARASLRLEERCRVFDVCVDPQSPTRFFLYEGYDAPADFDAHLESAHFLAFAADIEPWVVSRSFHPLTRLALEE